MVIDDTYVYNSNHRKGRMVIQLLATWIPALLIALSGVLKLSGNPKIVEGMAALGVGRYVRLLGVMELVFAALFVFPATMKLGFILASCYFGGAIATELSHDALKANPFVPIVLLWIGAFIRDRSIFF
jgi:hypothetical protein